MSPATTPSHFTTNPVTTTALITSLSRRSLPLSHHRPTIPVTTNAEKPLYEGCPDFTKLSAIVKLLNLKGKIRKPSDKCSSSECTSMIKKMQPAALTGRFKGCVVCGKDTNCVRLSASSKQSYAPIPKTGEQIYNEVKHIENKWGKGKRINNNASENQEDTRGRGGKIQKQKRNTTEEEDSSSQVNRQNVEKNVLGVSVEANALHNLKSWQPHEQATIMVFYKNRWGLDSHIRQIPLCKCDGLFTNLKDIKKAKACMLAKAQASEASSKAKVEACGQDLWSEDTMTFAEEKIGKRKLRSGYSDDRRWAVKKASAPVFYGSSTQGLLDAYGCYTIEEYLEWNYFPSIDNESTNMETTNKGNTDKDYIDDSNSTISKGKYVPVCKKHNPNMYSPVPVTGYVLGLAIVTTWDEIEKKMGARKSKTGTDKAKGKRNVSCGS
ncbi:hypothetical protein Tco_0428376 [Tanacetum coccineum]